MADLTTDFAGIKSPNPFWVASGPPANTAYQVMRAFEAGWGGAVWKTIGEPIVNTTSRYGSVDLGGSRVMGFNNIELISDRPVEDNLREIAGVKRRYPKHAVIASLMVESKREAWHEVVKRSEDAGADGLELNFGCPHGMSERGMGAAVGQVPEYTKLITSWVKEVARTPVLVKLTPNVTDVGYMGAAAREGGADGISLINTINSIMGIDLLTLAPRPIVDGRSSHGGYCGPAVKPIALNMVAAVAKHPKIGVPISGIGGIATWQDAAEFLLLGATTVQVCTAIMHYGFRIVEDMLDGLSNWMDERGFTTLADLRGRSLPNVQDWGDLNLNYKVIAEIHREKCIGCHLCYVACEDGAHQSIRLAEGAKQDPRDPRRPLRGLQSLHARVPSAGLHHDEAGGHRPAGAVLAPVPGGPRQGRRLRDAGRAARALIALERLSGQGARLLVHDQSDLEAADVADEEEVVEVLALVEPGRQPPPDEASLLFHRRDVDDEAMRRRVGRRLCVEVDVLVAGIDRRVPAAAEEHELLLPLQGDAETRRPVDAPLAVRNGARPPLRRVELDPPADGPALRQPVTRGIGISLEEGVAHPHVVGGEAPVLGIDRPALRRNGRVAIGLDVLEEQATGAPIGMVSPQDDLRPEHLDPILRVEVARLLACDGQALDGEARHQRGAAQRRGEASQLAQPRLEGERRHPAIAKEDRQAGAGLMGTVLQIVRLDSIDQEDVWHRLRLEEDGSVVALSIALGIVVGRSRHVLDEYAEEEIRTLQEEIVRALDGALLCASSTGEREDEQEGSARALQGFVRFRDLDETRGRLPLPVFRPRPVRKACVRGPGRRPVGPAAIAAGGCGCGRARGFRSSSVINRAAARSANGG
jgi:dihydropyrimidine dehydrogenase (NAD+) subunit PreA